MKPEFLELIREYPNDYDLGEYLRHTYVNDLNANPELVKLVDMYPNNYILGARARSFLLKS